MKTEQNYLKNIQKKVLKLIQFIIVYQKIILKNLK